MPENNTNVVVSLSTSIIQAGAFAELFSNALAQLPQNSLVDIEINIGAGNITIEAGAFQQSITGPLSNGITLNQAAFTFDAQSIPTLGSNVMAGLPVKTLVLPANTILQANALQNLQALQYLDASQLVNPIGTNAMNLQRENSTSLILALPSSPSVTYASGAITIPPTGLTGTTTLVFNGAFPDISTLSDMFSVNNSVTAPIQITVNYANTSSATSQQFLALQNSLTANGITPVAVSFNAVQNTLNGLTPVAALQPEGTLTNISQFAGDQFEYCIIAPKAQNGKTVNQCVVTSLSADAIKTNSQNIPIPSAITPANQNSFNVTNFVSKMNLDVDGLTSKPFYIIDNYSDPSDATLPSVTLIAIFSKDNAVGNTVGSFFPALVCNGTIGQQNGSVIVSGAWGVGASNPYLYGYSSRGDGTNSNTSVNLLATSTVGSIVPLYNKSALVNALPIATLSFPTATTFSIQFNPVSAIGNSIDPIVGCFQEYRPNGPNASMVVDFANVAITANSAWNTFSNSVAIVIANNNSLVNLLTQIRNYTLPAGVTVNPALPTTAVSISSELTVLSQANFNSALSAWTSLHSKYNDAAGYLNYLTTMTAYVDAAIIQTGTSSAPAYVSANSAFNGYKTALALAVPLVTTNALTDVVDVSPLYMNAISPYFNARVSIGMQAFKNCTLLDRTPNFEFVRSISKINDETFYFCSVLKSPITIPSNVVSIGTRAYYNCSDAPGIDIQNAFALRTIGESAFENCSSAAGSLSFSSALGAQSSVERIGNKAFYGCTSLTDHVYFPSNLVYLGVSAFESCSNLNGTIVFPTNPSFTSISDRAFADCSSLTGVSTTTGNGTSLQYLASYAPLAGPIPNGLIIPSNITQIGQNAFLNCSGFLGALNLQQSAQSAIGQIGNSAFSGCSSFTSLVLPSGPQYTTVSGECFRNCSNVASLTLSPNITTILESAFLGCIKIANVPTLSNVTSISRSAFSGCISMVGPLVLGTNLDILGDRAFFDCTYLTSATFLGPRPLALNTASLIFGVALPANTPFYVNVFTENGWDGSSVTAVNGILTINTAFRAYVATGGKSLVQMAFIDFNTYLPSPTSRELTINNYQSFNVYDNTSAGANAATTVPQGGFSWNDVYIPGTLRGDSLTTANNNLNQLPLLQKQVSALITPKVDAVQTSAVNLNFSVNSILNAFDGRNTTIAVGNPTTGAPIELVATTVGSTTLIGYGVVTANLKDYLYYAATGGEVAALVTSSNAILSFFVNSASLTKYANTIISVNSAGEISVSSSVTPIGYGSVDAPTAVLYTSVLPTTDRTGKGYTIVKSVVAGVLDKMYLNTILAPAGVYFVSVCSVAAPVQAAEAGKYNANVIYVKQDGSVQVSETQLSNDFQIVSVANLAASAGVIMNAGYAVVSSQQSGANTTYQLYYKATTNAVAVVAASYYYLIQSSDVPKLNDVMVLVLPNGGISTASFGISGSINALSSYTDALVSEPIPFYSTNAAFQNFDYYVNGVLPLAQTQYNDAKNDLEAKMTTYTVDNFIPLHTQLTPDTSSIGNTIATFGPTGQAVVTAFNNLNTDNTALQTTYMALSNAAGTNATYDDNVSVFKLLVTGTGVNSPLGLNQIQYNTLNNQPNGIYQFRRNSTFNSNALLSSVDPINGLVNLTDYVTNQINDFLTELLFMQYNNKNSTYADLVESVKANVSFAVSPTTDAVAKVLLYDGLSVQQQVLFDYVSYFVNIWYGSATTGAVGTAGGNNNWGTQSAGTVPGTGLYSVVAGTIAQTKANILAWAISHIVAYFNNGAATVYTQFVTNNQPNVIASFANVRTSVTTYESIRAGAPPNNDNVTANAAAMKAYVAAAAVKVLTIATLNNVVADLTTQSAPTVSTNGKLIFNNATLGSATEIFISLNDGQGTPSPISFAGYADTIALNGGLTYTINSITKTATHYTLSVSYIAGTAAAAATPIANGVVTFFTYQTVSSHTLAKLAAMNTYVWGQYYTNYTDQDGNQVNGIKAYLTGTKTKLRTNIVSVSAALNLVNVNSNSVLQKANALNVAEDVLTANLQSQNAIGTTLDLNGANMLARELALFGNALTNQINSTNSTPAVVTLPAYETKWFNDRIAAFWAEFATASPPTTAARNIAYNTADGVFKTKRYARQSAAIDLAISMSPPAQSIVSPVAEAFLSEQAAKFMQTMPAYLGTVSKTDLAELFGKKLAEYVLYRQIAGLGMTPEAKIAAITKYQADNQAAAVAAMQVANTEYGNAAYQRYIAVIDLAISFGYYAGLTGQAALVVGQTNNFQTLMQQWNAASNKAAVFDQLKPLLFDFVYTTNNAVYATSFPLKSADATVISWFGDATKSGFLYQIITNGLAFVSDAINSTATGIPYSTYKPTLNTATVGGTVYTLTTSSTAPTSTPTPPTLVQFSNSLSTPNTSNVTSAVAAAIAIASLQYNVVSIGYASISSAPAANLAAIGFTDVTAALNFSISQLNNTILYKFQQNGNGNAWQFGYQQSSTLVNSWSKLSPNQNVVIFYPGNEQNTPPAGLFASSQSSVNALCDNASYVMIIEAIASSTVKAISLYTYDVRGITSGALVAVGTLTPSNSPIPVTKLYSVTGALQKVANNPTSSGSGITLVGDLVIPSQVKTIGIRAFSNANQIKSLTFNAGTASSVVIGSNAFELCNMISAINLGQTIASIGPSAFLNCTGATSLSLPPINSTFSSVNHWAFLGCSNLGSSTTNGNLALNANLNQINVQAFAGCTKLQCSQLNGASSYMPQQLKKIGLGAFVGCVGLTGALNFNNVNQNGNYVSSIKLLGSAAFMGCVGLNGALSLPINFDYQNVLPYTFASMDAPLFAITGNSMNGVTALPMALTGVVDLSLTPTVTTVERNAFYNCAALSSLNLSNSVTSVGIQSFMQCIGLQSILMIPASVKTIGSEAFRSCSGLTGLNIVSAMVSQTASNAWLSLGNSCFQDCTSLAMSNTATGIVIPPTVSSIGDSAFQGCISIVSANVGSGLKNANSFGSSVFSGCTNLERVVLAFSFLSQDVIGQSVVKNAVLPIPVGGFTYNASFTGCTALGVPSDAPIGTIQIQSGATGWTPGRAAFFNNLTIVVNNKNITFYMSEFNQNIAVVDPSTEPVQQDYIPLTDAQAKVYIKASDMRKVFLTATDSFVNQDQINNEATDHGQLFFVRPEYFPQYLNVSNAHVTQGGIESYNAAMYEQLVKDDVMRYYAMSLFNSADWVTMFANDTEMIENMVASSGLMPIVPDGDADENGVNLYNTGVLYNIISELDKVSYTKPVGASTLLVKSTNYPTTTNKWWGLPDTVSADQGNIGKKLFGMISRNDPGRINSMVLNGALPSELPFLPGDQFVFVFTLNENKVQLATNASVVVKKRTYLIKLILTDDFNSGTPAFMDHANALYSPSPFNQNVLPVGAAYAADYMYSDYNMYLAIKPSVLNQTSNSVYSRVTQNTYEPIPPPLQLLPFTGWYYSYPHNTQSIKLDFTPPDISLTNKTQFNDMRYLSAYVYFPNNWSTVKNLPSANNFPQWVVKFTNDNEIVTFKFKAGFLSANAETINYLGQTVPFEYSNTHIQLVCPFDLTSAIPQFAQSQLNQLLAGKTADGMLGTINTIAGTDIWRQRSQLALVSGLRKTTSSIGPFTYPPLARGYQCIPMATTTAAGLLPSQIQRGGATLTTQAEVNALFTSLTVNDQYRLQSVALEINMSNNTGYVPSVIIKSVEVVAKNYETYYLAPLNPN